MSLDTRAPADLEALDQAVRAAASLCLHLAPLGGCALAIPGEASPRRIDSSLRGWTDARAALATVEAGGRAPRDRATAADAASVSGRENRVRATAMRACKAVTWSARLRRPGRSRAFTVAATFGQRLDRPPCGGSNLERVA